jgi:hypothetical protein
MFYVQSLPGDEKRHALSPRGSAKSSPKLIGTVYHNTHEKSWSLRIGASRAQFTDGCTSLHGLTVAPSSSSRRSPYLSIPGTA